MIVLDASVVVELLTNGKGANSLRAEIASKGGSFLAPHLLDIEVISALRRMTAGKRLDAHAVTQIIGDLSSLPMVRYPHTPLVDRIWELRHNFTPYDAAYIALAEATGAVLYTADAKMRRGHRAKVVLFAQ